METGQLSGVSQRGCPVLHLDLDAFFASVEQRDKPSLRGRPVVVGGTGGRGVVATASYEARRYGVRSAMPTWQARRMAPAGTAFLSGRWEAYSASSRIVMGLLHELSPLVEQVSVDEAYVDLGAGGHDTSPAGVRALARDLLAELERATGGLTASVGLASSKMMAKIASDLDKPSGLVVVEPGTEADLLAPMPVRTLAGVGPATAERIRTFGVETVADLLRVDEADLVSILGHAHGQGLYRLARARDDRPVVAEREAKSISAEETFEHDVTDPALLRHELRRLGRRVVDRLESHGAFARTVTLKLRRHDFSTLTRSSTLPQPTGDLPAVLAEAERLLGAVDVAEGVRLVGLGVSGFTMHAQAELALGAGGASPGAAGEALAGEVGEPPRAPVIPDGVAGDDVSERMPGGAPTGSGWRDAPGGRRFAPGADVEHAEHGRGWVWGSGLGRVTVRFEGPCTAPGPVRTFAEDDDALTRVGPPDFLC